MKNDLLPELLGSDTYPKGKTIRLYGSADVRYGIEGSPNNHGGKYARRETEDAQLVFMIGLEDMAKWSEGSFDGSGSLNIR
jgi:hypothetical protein